MPVTVVYKIISSGSATDLENKLNEAASEGWDVHTVLANQFGSTTVAHVLLERKLTE